MKKLFPISILFTFVCLVLTVIAAQFIDTERLTNLGFYVGRNFISTDSNLFIDFKLEKDFPSTDVNKITINAPNGDIKIKQSVKNQFKVKINGKTLKQTRKEITDMIYVENQNLIVNLFDSKDEPTSIIGQIKIGNNSISFENSLLVEIEIPKKSLEQLKINSTSANLEIRDLTSKKLDISGVSADMAIENSLIDSIKLNTVSGDMNLSYVDFNTASVNSISGDLTMETAENFISQVEFKTTSGEFSGLDEIQDTASPRKLEVTTVSGDVEIYK